MALAIAADDIDIHVEGGPVLYARPELIAWFRAWCGVRRVAAAGDDEEAEQGRGAEVHRHRGLPKKDR
jgi:hypothetical protein